MDVEQQLLPCSNLDCKGKAGEGEEKVSCFFCDGQFCSNCRKDCIHRDGKGWLCAACFDFLLELGQAFVEDQAGLSDEDSEETMIGGESRPRKRARTDSGPGLSTSRMISSMTLPKPSYTGYPTSRGGYNYRRY